MNKKEKVVHGRDKELLLSIWQQKEKNREKGQQEKYHKWG